jgi:magnesium transporter
MNFKNMSELNWQWGYFACLILMLAVSVGMLYYFKRKKWL